jgi:diacylglycerol kinase family enzyme
MHVALLHNPDAGDGAHSSAELVHLLERAGHRVQSASIDGESLRAVREHPPDVVLAAGGDGTARKVALTLAGSGVPMSILALGTANNLARTLGLLHCAERTIRELASYPARAIDVGVARGPWGEKWFIEGFGVGLFADYLDLLESPEFAFSPEALLDEGRERDLAVLGRLLPHFASRAWSIRADGVELDGSYFLVEALNIQSIGPFAQLAPQADPGDGQLDLVLLTERDRAAMAGYLSALDEDEDSPAPFSAQRCRSLELCGNRVENIHLDDGFEAVGEEDVEVKIELSVLPGAVRVLCPGTDGVSSDANRM